MAFDPRRPLLRFYHPGKRLAKLGVGYLRSRASVAQFGARPKIVGRMDLRVYGHAVFGDRFAAQSDRWRVQIYVDHGATLVVGDDVFMNCGTSIEAYHDIRIGNNVLMAVFSSVIDDDRHLAQPGVSLDKGPTVIEDNVWLGRSAAVMPGVTIGSGSVIAANSVVTKDIPKNSFAAGVPARVIRTLDIPDGWTRNFGADRDQPERLSLLRLLAKQFR